MAVGEGRACRQQICQGTAVRCSSPDGMWIIHCFGLSGDPIPLRICEQSRLLDVQRQIFSCTGALPIAQKIIVNDVALHEDDLLLVDVIPDLFVQRDLGTAPVPDAKIQWVQLCNHQEAEWLMKLDGGEVLRMRQELPELVAFERGDALFRLNWQRWDRANDLRFLRELRDRMDAFAYRSASNFPDLFQMLQSERFVYMALQLSSERFQRVRPWFVCLAKSHLRTSQDIAQLIVDKEPQIAVILDAGILEGRDLLSSALKTSGSFLRFAGEDQQADEEIVLTAVRDTGRALEFASAELRCHHGIVSTAVRQNGLALEFAEPVLQHDRSIVAAALQQCGMALQFVPSALTSDRELVSIAVAQNGAALQFASQELKDDREIVSLAVKQDGKALGSASERLRDDGEIVCMAIERCGYALEHASDTIRADRNAVITALRQSVRAFEFASQDLHEDEDLMFQAIKYRIDREISRKDQTTTSRSDGIEDYEFVVEGVRSLGVAALKLGPILQDRFLCNPRLALAAVQHCSRVYMQLNPTLRSELAIALAAVEKDWRLLLAVPYAARNHENIQVAAVSQNRLALFLLLPSDRVKAAHTVEKLKT